MTAARSLRALVGAGLASIALWALPHVALADSTLQVVSACGVPVYVAGSFQYPTMDTHGNTCSSASGGGGGATAIITPTGQAAYGISPVPSTAAEACHVLKASPGNLYDVEGVIGNAGYIMLFDAVSAPVDGAVTPKAWAYAPAPGSFSISYGIIPTVYAVGITVCASSTGPFTKTAFSTNTAFSGRVQ